MTPRPIRAPALAALALGGLMMLPACSAGEPAPSAPPPVAGAGAAQDDPARAAVGQAHRGALALVALGGLGAERGTTAEVRGLAERLAAEARNLDEAVRALATERELVLGDQLSAEQQALLADLEARSGAPFDQAWLRAVPDVQQQARAAAEAALAAPGASEEPRAAARAALDRLDALAACAASPC